MNFLIKIVHVTKGDFDDPENFAQKSHFQISFSKSTNKPVLTMTKSSFVYVQNVF